MCPPPGQSPCYRTVVPAHHQGNTAKMAKRKTHLPPLPHPTGELQGTEHTTHLVMYNIVASLLFALLATIFSTQGTTSIAPVTSL